MPEEKKSTNSNYNTPIAIIIAGLIIAAAVFYTKSPENGNTKNTANTQNKNQEQEMVGNEQVKAGAIIVRVDDDPVLGDPNAPITMIEFSDYECPFCKRYAQETKQKIVQEYIDTGKVKYIFRDLPLSFHDPVATEAAIAANCAREQGDDATYYEFNEEYFDQTDANGAGVPNGIESVAQAIGLNLNEFNECINSGRFDEEVASDLADAMSIASQLPNGGIGTPSFFIGLTNDSGEIETENISGAQPYEVFKAKLDQLLAE